MLKAKNKNKSIKDNTITIDYNKFLNNLIWRADEAPTFEEFMDEESKYNKQQKALDEQINNCNNNRSKHLHMLTYIC